MESIWRVSFSIVLIVMSVAISPLPESASYEGNIYKTCSYIDCHPKAEMNLAGYKAHVQLTPGKNPVEFYVCSFFVILTIGSFVPLIIFTVLDMARNVFPNLAVTDIPRFIKRILKR